MSEHDPIRLLNDVHLLNAAVDTALYNAIKSTEKPEYDHLREKTVREIEQIRDLADEILARESRSEQETDTE